VEPLAPVAAPVASPVLETVSDVAAPVLQAADPALTPIEESVAPLLEASSPLAGALVDASAPLAGTVESLAAAGPEAGIEATLAPPASPVPVPVPAATARAELRAPTGGDRASTGRTAAPPSAALGYAAPFLPPGPEAGRSARPHGHSASGPSGSKRGPSRSGTTSPVNAVAGGAGGSLFVAAVLAAFLLAAPGLSRRLRLGLAPWPRPIPLPSLERPG
jgi:hypothetical protein